MSILADFTVDPGGPLAWLFVGLVAGFLASRVLGGGGYGILGDLVIGLLGGFIGGYLFSSQISSSPNIVGNILVAFLGACILIVVLRFLSPGRRD